VAHGWLVEDTADLSPDVFEDYVRAPIEEVPASVAARIGACTVRIAGRLTPQAASRWTVDTGGARIELAAEDTEPHDLAMELLICLGQIVWDGAGGGERAEYLRLLEDELRDGIPGEIDDDVLPLKRRLLERPLGRGRLERYAAASFASTLAEYIHCLWHDVTVRSGPEHLDPETVRRRLELLARMFPPDPNQQLFG
jgi:hypothetical protein